MDLRQENSIAKVFLAQHGAQGRRHGDPAARRARLQPGHAARALVHAAIRSQRLVDGPDEVHRWTVGRNLITRVQGARHDGARLRRRADLNVAARDHGGTTMVLRYEVQRSRRDGHARPAGGEERAQPRAVRPAGAGVPRRAPRSRGALRDRHRRRQRLLLWRRRARDHARRRAPRRPRRASAIRCRVRRRRRWPCWSATSR